MTPGLAALRNDELGAERFEMLRLGDGGRRAADEHAERAELAQAIGGKIGEVRRDGARAYTLDRVELGVEVRCERRLHGLGRAEAELGIKVRHGVERGALVFHFAGLGGREEVDDEGRLRAFTYPRRLLLHVCRLRISEAKTAQRTGGAARGDQLLAARPARHRRLDDRHADAELRTE